MSETPSESIGKAVLDNTRMGDWIIVKEDGKRVRLYVANVRATAYHGAFPYTVVLQKEFEVEANNFQWDGKWEYMKGEEFCNLDRKLEVLEASR